ncbi:Glutaredoxin 3, partial [Cladochytrium tenue]
MTLKSNVVDVTSDEQFEALLSAATRRGVATVVNFCADWAPQYADMNQIKTKELYEVAAVQTFVIIRVAERIEGANAPALTNAVEKFSKLSAKVPATASLAKPIPAPAATKEQLFSRLRSLLSTQSVMLFMKGTTEAPRCGFSRQLVEILSDLNVTYGTFDILADEEGELVGSLDIVKELVALGEFKTMLPPPEDLETRLKRLQVLYFGRQLTLL